MYSSLCHCTAVSYTHLIEERLQEATLQQTKSNASYNSTMTENSKSQAKLNEANTNLAVLDKQLADYKAYLKELQDKLAKSQRETQRQLSEESYELSRKSANLSKELQDSATSADRAKEINKELQDISASQARNSYVQSSACLLYTSSGKHCEENAKSTGGDG